jgi:mercuric ion transport protein
MKKPNWEKGTLIGAMIAAIVASLCCVGPLVLIALGIGGAWISTLTHLEFLRPIGIIITLSFLGIAFWKLYITPKQCSVDKLCANPRLLRVQHIIFWIVTILLLLLLAFPWYAFLFY